MPGAKNRYWYKPILFLLATRVLNVSPVGEGLRITTLELSCATNTVTVCHVFGLFVTPKIKKQKNNTKTLILKIGTMANRLKISIWKKTQLSKDGALEVLDLVNPPSLENAEICYFSRFPKIPHMFLPTLCF